VSHGCQKIPVLLAFSILAAETGHGDQLSAVKDGLELWLQHATFPDETDPVEEEDIFSKIGRVLERDGKSDLAKIARRLGQREKTQFFGSKAF
jgi:hypothetical protein